MAGLPAGSTRSLLTQTGSPQYSGVAILAIGSSRPERLGIELVRCPNCQFAVCLKWGWTKCGLEAVISGARRSRRRCSLTTDYATAQVSGRTTTRVSSRTMLKSMIKLDDFENSFAALPARAGYSRKSQTTPSLWPGRASRIVGMNSASEPSSLYQPETASATGQIAFVDFANICVFWIDHLGAPRFGNLAKQHIGFRRRH